MAVSQVPGTPKLRVTLRCILIQLKCIRLDAVTNGFITFQNDTSGSIMDTVLRRFFYAIRSLEVHCIIAITQKSTN